MDHLSASIPTTALATLATTKGIYITNSAICSTCHRPTDGIYTIDATADYIACRIGTLTHHPLCPLEERRYGFH